MTKQTKRLNLQRRLKGITMPITRKRFRLKRNWSCLCGNDKKYKHCCMLDIESLTRVDDNATIESLPEDIQKIIDTQIDNNKKKGQNINV